MKTEIILVRHGESVANNRHLIAGVSDFPLTRNGRKQAKSAARGLKNIKVNAVYSSNLSRAETTGMFIAKSKKLPLHIHAGLREIDCGAYESKYFDGDIEKDEIMKKYVTDYVNAGYPEGETVKQVGLRVVKALEEISQKHPNQTIVVASHSCAIIASYAYVKAGYDLDKMLSPPKLCNASFTYLTYQNGKLSCGEFGVSNHLRGNVTEFFESVKK